MTGDPEQEKLEEMAARIRQAEAASKPAQETPEKATEAVKASRIGFDFVATIVVCAVLGWGADRGFGTQPWGLLVMLLIGFIAGIANVWRALGSYDHAVGWNKRNGK